MQSSFIASAHFRQANSLGWTDLSLGELEHANPDEFLTGEGSRKFGGRWNAPGTFPSDLFEHKAGNGNRGSFSARVGL